MKTWLLKIVGKLLGFPADIWGKLAGYKTKIAGVAMILSGAAEVLQKALTLTDMASVLAFAKTLPQDAGWLTLLAGLAVFGFRSAMDKPAA